MINIMSAQEARITSEANASTLNREERALMDVVADKLMCAIGKGHSSVCVNYFRTSDLNDRKILKVLVSKGYKVNINRGFDRFYVMQIKW